MDDGCVCCGVAFAGDSDDDTPVMHAICAECAEEIRAHSIRMGDEPEPDPEPLYH